MAFNVYDYFHNLDPRYLSGTASNLNADQLASTVQSYLNKIATNPSDQESLNALSELVGPNITTQVLNGYRGDAAPDPSQLPQLPALPSPGSSSPQTPGNSSGNLTSLPALPPFPEPVTNGAGFLDASGGGITFGNINADTSAILKNAIGQRQEGLDTLNLQSDRNQKFLGDMSSLLQKQQTNQLSAELPGVYEDLNSRGLLRSSALGEKLAIEQGNLAQQTSSELAKQGLQFQNDYTKGLGDISTNYMTAENQALGRSFNLEDYNNQIRASQLLGYALQPKPQDLGKSAGQGAVMSSGIQAAGTLAAAGK